MSLASGNITLWLIESPLWAACILVGLMLESTGDQATADVSHTRLKLLPMLPKLLGRTPKSDLEQ